MKYIREDLHDVIWASGQLTVSKPTIYVVCLEMNFLMNSLTGLVEQWLHTLTARLLQLEGTSENLVRVMPQI